MFSKAECTFLSKPPLNFQLFHIIVFTNKGIIHIDIHTLDKKLDSILFVHNMNKTTHLWWLCTLWTLVLHKVTKSATILWGMKNIPRFPIPDFFRFYGDYIAISSSRSNRKNLWRDRQTGYCLWLSYKLHSYLFFRVAYWTMKKEIKPFINISRLVSSLSPFLRVYSYEEKNRMKNEKLPILVKLFR